MIWKRYQNELIIALALLLLLGTLSYKNRKTKGVDMVKTMLAKSTIDASEIISLQKQWSSPKLSQNILQLKKRITATKIKHFSVKGKKLMASFQNLNSKEMNNIVTRLENIAVQIIKLEVKRVDKEYMMEIQCKW